jgi:hypothetical protein
LLAWVQASRADRHVARPGLNGRVGVPVTDAAGGHTAWFVPEYGAISDDEAARYASDGDPGIPNPVVSSSGYNGLPTGFDSSGG